MASEAGYINYFETLGLENRANPGEVRKTYKKQMKQLLQEIAQVEVTPDRRAQFILQMSNLNAAVYVLKDKERRENYWDERQALIDLEAEWCALDESDHDRHNELRPRFDNDVQSFLSKYVQEMPLNAGSDHEVMEASHWDEAHARHATQLLRQSRHDLYTEILERLPYHEVTKPKIDWSERQSTVAELLEGLC